MLCTAEQNLGSQYSCAFEIDRAFDLVSAFGFRFYLKAVCSTLLWWWPEGEVLWLESKNSQRCKLGMKKEPSELWRKSQRKPKKKEATRNQKVWESQKVPHCEFFLEKSGEKIQTKVGTLPVFWSKVAQSGNTAQPRNTHTAESGPKVCLR